MACSLASVWAVTGGGREGAACAQTLGGVPTHNISPPSSPENAALPTQMAHRRQSSQQGDNTGPSPGTLQGTEALQWMGWQEPKMLPFHEDDDIEHHLTTFEWIAQACRWPSQDRTLHLVPLLTGKERAAYLAVELTLLCLTKSRRQI